MEHSLRKEKVNVNMNFFTDELKKIADRSEFIQKPKYVGQSCVFRLSDDVTGKLQFVTRGHADNYTALKLSLFNKREGPIDIQIMNIVDVIGRKRVLGELRSPYIWKYGNDIDWYSYHPDDKDYSAMSETVDDYLSCFAEQELTEDEELSISLN